MKYLIVIEKTKKGFSGYSPDLEGCVAAGKTRAEVEKMMKEAIVFHLEGLREDKKKIPAPRSFSAFVEIPA